MLLLRCAAVLLVVAGLVSQQCGVASGRVVGPPAPLSGAELRALLGRRGAARYLQVGDMLVPRGAGRGAANVHRPKRWRSRFIPVRIRRGAFSAAEADLIRAQWRHIENGTCVRFVSPSLYEESAPVLYVRSEADRDCRATVGRPVIGYGKVILGRACVLDPGTLQHEILHSLGFYHEQTRPDRDDYINVHWENIREEMKGQYMIQPYTDTLGQPYNYNSVMHYHPMKGGNINAHHPTMCPKNITRRIRPDDKMNALDFQAVNILFNCTCIGIQCDGINNL